MDLRGVSAEALADLTSVLSDEASGPAASRRLGEELFVAAGVLRSEPWLRRVLTDVTQPTEAKQGLVESLFGGKVGDPALSVLKAAVAQRWTLSRDLPDALERLSEIAATRSAGKDGGKVVDELFEVHGLLANDPELRDALANPARSIEDKSALVDDVFDGKVHPATVTLLKQSLAGTYRTVPQALATYRRVAASVAEEIVATLHVVHPLADADRRRIADILSRQYGRTVHVNEVLDPEVLGGILIEIGDDVIDGTIANRLADARRRLVG